MDSPRMCVPSASKVPICPPAPRKPARRGAHSGQASSYALSLARESVMEARSPAGSLLQHIPRHCLQPVFQAYVDFIAQPEGGPQVQEFMQLLEVAPGIEEEVFAVAMQAMPDATMSWESWHQCLLAASQSPQLKEQMADRFAHSTSSSARRAL
ncbi:hypothetical protein V8C86DRAFT_2874720, partial [Haematococcus lacustris]